MPKNMLEFHYITSVIITDDVTTRAVCWHRDTACTRKPLTFVEARGTSLWDFARNQKREGKRERERMTKEIETDHEIRF